MAFPKLLALVVALVGLLTVGCGGSGAARSGADGADRAFVEQMLPHHESAVAMATLGLRRARHPEVRALSADILRSQRAEIVRMRAADARLARAGVRPGDLGVAHAQMGMDMDTGSLRDASPFDPAFLRMMTPHHRGAITMARAELARGRDPELRELATRIITVQEGEIGLMDRLLQRG